VPAGARPRRAIASMRPCIDDTAGNTRSQCKHHTEKELADNGTWVQIPPRALPNVRLAWPIDTSAYSLVVSVHADGLGSSTLRALRSNRLRRLSDRGAQLGGRSLSGRLNRSESITISIPSRTSGTWSSTDIVIRGSAQRMAARCLVRLTHLSTSQESRVAGARPSKPEVADPHSAGGQRRPRHDQVRRIPSSAGRYARPYL
jgi:hypothetical protein